MRHRRAKPHPQFIAQLFGAASADGEGTARMNSAWRQRTVKRLIARDGRGCYLCGGRIDQPLGLTPRSMSIDHVVPRSKGGTNALPNLRLAHRECNMSKGSGR